MSLKSPCKLVNIVHNPIYWQYTEFITNCWNSTHKSLVTIDKNQNFAKIELQLPLTSSAARASGLEQSNPGSGLE